jgi:hypothetical protein
MWLFGKEKSLGFESWPIVRSKPVGKTYGSAISLFINNASCHLVTIDVYADGAIDCWGIVDRALFKTKLDKQWVVPGPKFDQPLSVFNFGFGRVQADKWVQTRASIEKVVEGTIRSLNPGMKNLIDMQGSEFEPYGKGRKAKFGMGNKRAYRISDATKNEVLAESVPILRSADRGWDLTRLFVFADGLLRIGPAGELFPLQELPTRYADREIGNQASAGSTIRLPGLGEFQPSKQFGSVSVHDRIVEIHDLVDKLNGGDGVVRRCARHFAEYLSDPTPEKKDALRDAYEAVPHHLRPYCGDMDTRDTDIRRVLFES